MGGPVVPEDSGSLVKLVEFLAGRKPSALTLVEDSPPRSVAAAKLVRDTAARNGLAVQTEGGRTPRSSWSRDGRADIPR